MDSEEFSLTASQRRAMKKKEKKKRKQVAKGAPAVQPRQRAFNRLLTLSTLLTLQPRRRKPEESKTRAVRTMRTMNLPRQTKTTTTPTPSHRSLPAISLRGSFVGVYAQLELFVKSKEEPPAGLLQLVLRDVDQSDAQFERVNDFPSEEVNPEITALDQPAVQSTHHSTQSSAHPSAHPSTHSSSTCLLYTSPSPRD